MFPWFKRILSRFWACSGSQKFNLCSGLEQSQFPRFYTAKCRRWNLTKNISLYFTHRQSEIVWFGSYFIPALGFNFTYKVKPWEQHHEWVTFRKGSQVSFKSHEWSLKEKRMAIKHKQLMRSIELAHVQTREDAVLTLRTFANFILCMQGTKCDNYVELIILIWQGFLSLHLLAPILSRFTF